jgi:XTP/dITP diphosphohydrolase
VVVEDSGLSIKAWNGFPGALVKWLEKSAGLEAMAGMLDRFPRPFRRPPPARWRTSTESASFRHAARCRARSRTPPAARGFGWDALFIPDGSDRTFAEMSGEEKDASRTGGAPWEALARQLAGVIPGR